jgi:hypothetical protein
LRSVDFARIELSDDGALDVVDAREIEQRRPSD